LPTDRIAKGGMNTEQLNIEGKRSGSGMVAHKATLVNALSRALSERVALMDFTIGRKGFLAYLKSLGGSNIVKIVPAAAGASESQADSDKRLKVVCGNNTSFLEDKAWVDDNTPMSLCDVRISPSNTVKPNLGSTELSEALSRVLPFTAKEDNRPVLQCILFRVMNGKLTLVSADGFRLAMVKLDCDCEEGEVLIDRDELQGVAGALRRARRVRVSLEKDKEDSFLTLDTELIRYRWQGMDGNFPDYEKLIPADFNTLVSFDTNEAIRAVSSLKVLANCQAYPIDLTITDGKLTLSCPDDKGIAEIAADTQGEVRIRLDGSYLADALRACGGMVELKLVDSNSPMLFTAPDYELVVMPMAIPTDKAEPVKVEASQPTEATDVEVEKAQAVAEAEAITEAEKPKRKHRAKEPVAVA
jgi:DNA polymerase III subunit beta